MAAALRALGLVKRFAGTLALDGVGLELEEGEVRGLLGPNGAGKTTLLRVLLGLVSADAGSVEIFGQELDDPSCFPSDLVAGFVEDPRFYPYLSARVNLEVLAELDGRALPAGTIDDALARAGLAESGDDRVGGFSSGMRQRLGLAASLLRSPRILLLDEPAAGLDPAALQELAATIVELAAEGAAILISSHQIGEVDRLCGSFTFLRRGAVAWSGTADELHAQAPPGIYRLLTSDDRLALRLAGGHDGVLASTRGVDGLELVAPDDRLDGYVLSLAEAGVAVRRLELLMSPVESMFFALTADSELGLSGAIAAGAPR